VTGSVSIAKVLGVSDLMIGLTIVALGTSLPELASSVTAALRNEHEIAFGNIIGSNLFNTLCVVGIAGVIRPMSIESSVLFRDVPVMSALTASLFITGYGFKGRPGRINRLEGLVLLLAYLLYTGWIAAGYVRS
jgi:cation:H+ antiporter